MHQINSWYIRPTTQRKDPCHGLPCLSHLELEELGVGLTYIVMALLVVGSTGWMMIQMWCWGPLKRWISDRFVSFYQHFGSSVAQNKKMVFFCLFFLKLGVIYIQSWWFLSLWRGVVHSGKLRYQWKMDPDWRCMDPIENGNIPASYVSYVSSPKASQVTKFKVCKLKGKWTCEPTALNAYGQANQLHHFKQRDNSTGRISRLWYVFPKKCLERLLI